MGLPLSEGMFVILTVVDSFTKFFQFFSISHPYTTTKVAKVFVDGVFKLHGLPQTIVSDHDPIFTSSL